MATAATFAWPDVRPRAEDVKAAADLLNAAALPPCSSDGARKGRGMPSSRWRRSSAQGSRRASSASLTSMSGIPLPPGPWATSAQPPAPGSSPNATPCSSSAPMTPDRVLPCSRTGAGGADRHRSSGGSATGIRLRWASHRMPVPRFERFFPCCNRRVPANGGHESRRTCSDGTTCRLSVRGSRPSRSIPRRWWRPSRESCPRVRDRAGCGERRVLVRPAADPPGRCIRSRLRHPREHGVRCPVRLRREVQRSQAARPGARRRRRDADDRPQRADHRGIPVAGLG